MAASIIPMVILVNSTPDQIPADVIAEEQERAKAAQNDEYLEKEKLGGTAIREV